MVLVDSHGISRVPRYSGTRRKPIRCHLPGCHRLWPTVPDRSISKLVGNSPPLKAAGPYNPTVQARWFGLIRVRSPLLAESLLFSLPAGTEMVHFPALPSHSLCIQPWIWRHNPPGVSPFGNPRIKAHLQLPEAYRSLSRPSSTSSAKAFTVRP